MNRKTQFDLLSQLNVCWYCQAGIVYKMDRNVLHEVRMIYNTVLF